MPGYLIGRLLGLPSYRDKTTALVLTAQETAYKAILVLLTFTAILWMSIFMYASFYYSYMPAISHVRPVHLQFNSCGRERGLCTYPSANVTLTRRQKLLMVGQPYKILVELEMPESLANQKVGMFMVCAELKDFEQKVVEKSCRSAILHYKSFVHHAIATFIYAPFLLSGSAEEKQLVPVELFSGFQEHPEHPATEAYIEVQSQHVEVYQTYLKIHAHFTGLRYFMFHWPILAAILGISTNFFFLAIIAFLSWYKYFTYKQVVVHVGYDGNAARNLEERRAAAKERLMKERDQLASHQNIEEEIKKEKEEMMKAQMEERIDGKSKMEVPAYEKLAEEIISVKLEEISDSEKSKESHRTSDEFELLSEKVSASDGEISDVDEEDNDDEKENQPKKSSSKEDKEKDTFEVRKRKRTSESSSKCEI